VKEVMTDVIAVAAGMEIELICSCVPR